jgi:hypothetical protein
LATINAAIKEKANEILRVGRGVIFLGKKYGNRKE